MRITNPMIALQPTVAQNPHGRPDSRPVAARIGGMGIGGGLSAGCGSEFTLNFR
jgi:hypothetical protein